jgi:hypothetical protein
MEAIRLMQVADVQKVADGDYTAVSTGCAGPLHVGVADVQAVYERLKTRGVVSRTPPTTMGPVTVAVFEDTCGNLIQLAQK